MIHPHDPVVCSDWSKTPAGPYKICAFTQKGAPEIPMSWMLEGLSALTEHGCRVCGSIQITEIAKRIAEAQPGRYIEGSEDWPGLVTVNYIAPAFDDRCRQKENPGLCEKYVEDGQ